MRRGRLPLSGGFVRGSRRVCVLWAEYCGIPEDIGMIVLKISLNTAIFRHAYADLPPSAR